MVLRSSLDEDVPLIQDVSADPLIRLITRVPTTPRAEEARAFISRQRARLTSGEGYSFAIADVETGQAVGQIGLWLRDLAQGRASLCYWVSAQHRRRVFASNARRAVSQVWAHHPEGSPPRAIRRTLERGVVACRRRGRIPARRTTSQLAARRRSAPRHVHVLNAASRFALNSPITDRLAGSAVWYPDADISARRVTN